MPLSFETFTGHDPTSLRGGEAGNLRFCSCCSGDPGGYGQPPPRGVTAFVGGNNVGKSILLRQIVAWIRAEPSANLPTPPVLDALKLTKVGTGANLAPWL